LKEEEKEEEKEKLSQINPFFKAYFLTKKGV
jgi:hypothetical protein